MRRGELFWGSILILFGGLLLARQLGISMPGGEDPLAFFWPLALIFAGLWVLAGIFLFHRHAADEHISLDLQGAREAAIRMDHGAGRLMVKSGAGPGQLLTGTFGSGLEQETRLSGEKLEARLKMPAIFFPFGWKPNLDWDLALTRDIPLSLHVNSGASRMEFDLTELQVTFLDLDTGASSTRLLLPSQAGATLVEIEAGAASVEIQVPQGVAARIRIKDGISAVDIDQARFPRLEGLYQSSDYPSAANRVDINIDAGVGRISIQ